MNVDGNAHFRVQYAILSSIHLNDYNHHHRRRRRRQHQHHLHPHLKSIYHGRNRNFDSDPIYFRYARFASESLRFRWGWWGGVVR